jgi:uncharacterized membrane protein
MIIFHFCYDLRYFGHVDWDIPNGAYWWPFRYFIVGLFTFTLGLSLSLAYSGYFNRAKFFKRLLQLLLAALIVTVSSFFLFPDTWIYFGILHFMLVASLLGVGFVHWPKLALILAVVILMGYYFGLLSNDFPFNYLNHYLPNDTEDFVPLFPWLAWMFLGVGIAGFYPIGNIALPCAYLLKSLALAGKHGLLIYLIHQPMLFLGFGLFQFLNK